MWHTKTRQVRTRPKHVDRVAEQYSAVMPIKIYSLPPNQAICRIYFIEDFLHSQSDKVQY